MKNKLLIIIILLFITGCTNKPEKSVTCIAEEKLEEGLSTKVTTQYYYNKSGLQVTGIDYIIEIKSENDYNQLIATKSFYENTICNTANLPSNVSCNMEITDNELKVITHENVEDNQSTVLKVGDLSKFTYDSFKNHQDEKVECKLN